MQKYQKKCDKKVHILKQNYDDVVNKHNSDIGLNHREKMTIETNPEILPVVSKPDPLPSKHHKIAKEETEYLLEATLI